MERPNGSRRVVSQVSSESKTEQCHAAEVDINQIVARYQRTGMLPQGTKVPRYGDFTGVVDYHTACDSVLAAQAAFMSLPAKVRERFANDPGALLEFLGDEKNREEAYSLGILERPLPDEVPEVVVTPEVVETPVAS